MDAISNALLQRGMELVCADLEARGWSVHHPPSPGPARLWASRPGTRRVIYLACSRYPEAPPVRAEDAIHLDEGEPWLARVQVSRRLAPILSPEYVRLSPLVDREATSTWPPAPTGLTF